MGDPLDDPVVREALRRAAARTVELCRRCVRDPAGDDGLCRSCRRRLVELDREDKAAWWRRRGGAKVSAVQGATTWLKAELRKGPVRSSEIKRRARDAGISTTTLQRARVAAGVTHRRQGNGPDHRTVWELPMSDLTRSQSTPDGTSRSGGR